jgi:hypothetical protein
MKQEQKLVAKLIFTVKFALPEDRRVPSQNHGQR